MRPVHAINPSAADRLAGSGGAETATVGKSYGYSVVANVLPIDPPHWVLRCHPTPVKHDPR
jgi:hypothetical protein